MKQKLNEKYFAKSEKAFKELQKIYDEENKLSDNLSKYSVQVSGFILDMYSLEEELREDYFEKHTFEELLELNHSYYDDISGNHYLVSFANPDVAVKAFGQTGKVLSAVYAEIRMCVGYAFEGRSAAITRAAELFMDMYQVYSESRSSLEQIYDQLIMLYKADRYKDLKEKHTYEVKRIFSKDLTPYAHIPNDYKDEKRIFKYGMHIGYNEIELVKYFDTCSEEQLQAMADTYTEAFLRGFERNNVDLSNKTTVNIAYHIGFEPVIIKAYENLKKVGLEPLVFYDLAGSLRPRLMNTKASKQFEYDHRFDQALYMDDKYVDHFLKVIADIYEENKDFLTSFAGPAVMEVFGEKPYAPISKDTCVSLSKADLEIETKYNTGKQESIFKYMPRSNWSFVIISYPCPEIGDQFKEIFDETIKVNTLDEQVYMDIQQYIIDALDTGVKAHITGRNGNKTDLYVALNEHVDTKTQSNFNNCTADVNVPVGEVFTSPKLEGTSGKLHVKEVYLHGLKYKHLEIDFKDGMMDVFTCKNFDDEVKNKEFMLENLTHPHKTLPLGEFAIGTNTTAYAMAKKFDIEKIIPILIGEKMGPHFAVGDTCYTWSEDTAVFNPDGKEIVARENSKTKLRKTNVKDAYTYCHTDITIPYSELGSITVLRADGSELAIIENGRFVLDGTQALNEPLKDIEV